MSGASARYSCLHTPVETVTPPCRQTKPAPFRFPGFRKSRESSISAISLFLSKSNPLRWASILFRSRKSGKLSKTKPASLGFGSCSTIGPAPMQASPSLQANQHFSGSGYSTPKVSTVTFFITWGIRGLSFQSVRTSQMWSTTSMPSMTLPKAA